MVEQRGFKEPETEQNQREDYAEIPFQAERGFRTTSDQVNRPESRLQALSPDKPVVLANDLNNLSPDQLSLLKRCLAATSEQFEKVGGPLRTAYNKEMQSESSSWVQGYRDKVGGVLRDNINDVGSEIPFRVAFPVQSFLPGPDGVVQAETLYAFFPPLQNETNIKERYITIDLHSENEAREAQLRGSSSFGTSISSHELEFCCKRTTVGSAPLMERRTNSDQ